MPSEESKPAPVDKPVVPESPAKLGSPLFSVDSFVRRVERS